MHALRRNSSQPDCSKHLSCIPRTRCRKVVQPPDQLLRFRAELSLNRFHAVETDTMASRSLIEIECSSRDEAVRVISAFT